MKMPIISGLLLACCLATPVGATEYIYRDLMANSVAPEHCDVEAKATQNAAKSYNIDRFSKKFCQTQGYGWHVEEVRDAGKTVCNSCGDAKDLKRCHQEDIVVTCKRIKPGSVGMLPGKGG